MQNDWFAQSYILSTFQRATVDSFTTELRHESALAEKTTNWIIFELKIQLVVQTKLVFRFCNKYISVFLVNQLRISPSNLTFVTISSTVSCGDSADVSSHIPIFGVSSSSIRFNSATVHKP